MTTKTNFNQIKTQQEDVEKKELDTLQVPGIIKPKEKDTETILSPSGFKKEVIPIGQIRQAIELRLQEHFLNSEYPQLVEVTSKTFKYQLGRPADHNIHLFKGKYKIVEMELVIDWTKCVQIYQTDPPPMLSPEEQEQSEKEAEKEYVEEPLPHPDQALKERDIQPSPDDEIKTHPPMLDKTKGGTENE